MTGGKERRQKEEKGDGKKEREKDRERKKERTNERKDRYRCFPVSFINQFAQVSHSVIASSVATSVRVSQTAVLFDTLTFLLGNVFAIKS